MSTRIGWSGLRSADFWTLAYLALPNMIFLAGWVRPEFGLPAALLLLLSVGFLCRDRPVLSNAPRLLGLALIVALPWLFLSGIGHFVYANSDWIVRDAVLADLVRDAWPVIYRNIPDQPDLMLRAPIAYFLPAAVAGKVLGAGSADFSLFLWSLMGVVLAFLLVIRNGASSRKLLSRLLVFVLFSGMDLIGTVFSGKLPGFASHIEWWAGIYQYSSHTTQLFWVPNHALPGWIAIAWLLGIKRGTLPVGLAIAVVACVPLWSPLTAIGLAPIFAVAILREFGVRRVSLGAGLRLLFHPAAVAIALVACALIFPYLLMEGKPLPSIMSFEGVPADVYWTRYVQFVLVEFLVLAVLLMRHFRRDAILITAALVLLLLPLFKFGPYNDLVMRASIPALAVLAIRLGQWFSELWASTDAQSGGEEDYSASIAMFVFAIGVLTPLLEISRVLVAPIWTPDVSRTVLKATNGNAPHYLAPANQTWPKQFLRDQK